MPFILGYRSQDVGWGEHARSTVQTDSIVVDVPPFYSWFEAVWGNDRGLARPKSFDTDAAKKPLVLRDRVGLGLHDGTRTPGDSGQIIGGSRHAGQVLDIRHGRPIA